MQRVYLGTDHGQHPIMCAWHPAQPLLATHSVMYHHNSLQVWSVTGELVAEWLLPLRHDPELAALGFRSAAYEQADLGATLLWLNDQHLMCELAGSLYVIDQEFKQIPWNAAARHEDQIVFALHEQLGVFDCRTRSILWKLDLPLAQRPTGRLFALQWSVTGDSFVYQVPRSRADQAAEHTLIISRQGSEIQTQALADVRRIACYSHSRYTWLDRFDTIHWRAGQQTGTLPVNSREHFFDIQYSADGKLIAVAENNLLSLYKFEGSLIWQRRYGHPDTAISDICWHPTKPILMIATWQGYVYVQDVIYRSCDRYDCRFPERVTSSFAPIVAMQWDRTGTYLATSQRGATVYIWRDLC